MATAGGAVTIQVDLCERYAILSAAGVILFLAKTLLASSSLIL